MSRGPGRPTKLTKKLQDLFVEHIINGCSYRTTCAALNIGSTTFKRWMIYGRSPDPANRRYRSFRAHVKRARAVLELNCLKRINLASMQPKYWTAAAWILQNVIRGSYLKTAKSLRPQMELTVSDISRMLAEGDLLNSHHQNGDETVNGNGKISKQIVHMSSCLSSDRISLGIKPDPIFKSCEYCGTQYQIKGYRQKFCSRQCRDLDRLYQRGEIISEEILVHPDPSMAHHAPEQDADDDDADPDQDDRFLDPNNDGGELIEDDDEDGDGGGWMGNDPEEGILTAPCES